MANIPFQVLGPVPVPVPVQLPAPFQIPEALPMQPVLPGIMGPCANIPGISLQELLRQLLELQWEMHRKDAAIKYLDSRCVELMEQHHRENSRLRIRVSALEDKVRQLQQDATSMESTKANLDS